MGNRDIFFILYNFSSLLIFLLLALIDLITGRIPFYILLVSILCVILYGLLFSDILDLIMGGVINLATGLMIFWLGKKYLSARSLGPSNLTAFGWGDVYGVGVIGFLLGFPEGFYSFFLSLSIFVVFAFISSLITRQPFKQLSFPLGPFFFVSALLFLVLRVWP